MGYQIEVLKSKKKKLKNALDFKQKKLFFKALTFFFEKKKL